jgi:lipopolysaccharide/colanic/teichoic acid biosynthesis glycosyltransferase
MWDVGARGPVRGVRVPLSESPNRFSQHALAMAGRVVVVWLAVAIMATAHRPLVAGGLIGISVAAAIWLVGLRAAAARAPYVLGPGVPSAIGATVGLVGVAAVNPYVPGLHLSIGSLLGMSIGIFVSSTAWESVLDRTARRRVLVVGSSAVADLQKAARQAGRLSFEMVAAEPLGDDPDGSAELSPVDLAPIIAAQRPDLIVLADERSSSQAVERLLDITDGRFHVVGLTGFYEYAFGCVPLSRMTPLWFMSLLHVRQRAPRRPSKRIFDVVVALVGLLVLALLFPIFALAIKCTPGPVIYRQTRLGERGRRFTMYKLRTMSATAEADCGAVFAQAVDPRCTRVGRWLRRTHLDELPQLWNVLKGDMSIVGPRPERPEHIAMLEQGVPYWSRRLLLRPGVTGWAQVQSGYADDCASAAEKLSRDFWYMRHGNLAIDVAVCLQTGRLALEALNPRRLLLRFIAPASREHALR